MTRPGDGALGGRHWPRRSAPASCPHARSSTLTSPCSSAPRRASTPWSPTVSTPPAPRPTMRTRASRPRRPRTRSRRCSGCPFTVKESIAVAGMPHSAGLIARAAAAGRRERADRRAPAIGAGAIPLGVTNTSELTLWIESVNRLYGRTSNPYAAGRAAGGSSGGEGAVVGSGGSPFGLASDIGGSIRVPALFCGVFGHKPSSGLVPTSGNFPPSDAGNSPLLGLGPIARRAEDLIAVLRIIAGPDGVDTSTAARRDRRSRRGVARGPAGRDRRGDIVAADQPGAARRPRARRRRAGRRRRADPPRPDAVMAPGDASVPRPRSRTGRRARPPSWSPRPAAGAPGRARLLAPGRPAHDGHASDPAGRGASRHRHRRRCWPRPRAGRELRAVIGDGVLLHPAHRGPAPRSGTTVGRPWLLTPAAIFNLAEVPVTEVPIGRSARGLPLGVQVAGAHGSRSRDDRRRARARACLRGLVAAVDAPEPRGDRHALS